MLTDYARYRLYEILPGLSIWLTLILCFLLSFLRPLWMIYFIIIFDIYWVLRVIYFSVYLILSWLRFRRSSRVDWYSRVKNDFPDWKKIKNVIFLPLANEDWIIVKETLDAIARSSYPAREIYIVLSGEERKIDNWSNIQEKVKQEYQNVFADIIYCTHPKDLPGEIVGKGSNVHYAEWQFKKYADVKGWKYEEIIASIFDIDTIVHPHYFSHLTHVYLSHPRPTRSSFQPIILYNNNLWESPSVLRVMALSTSFWLLFSLARLDNLVTFSSHSMSFQAIIDCGGHAKDIISEDSRIFFQCWLKYNSDYEVTPLYIPLSMDTVREDSWIKSLKNLYYQQRRWAWGTEQIPYLLWNLRNNKMISWWKKTVVLFHEWEGKWSWGVVAILITVVGRLPLWVAGNEIRQSALFFNTPNILEILMSLAMLGLLVSMIMSMLVLPRQPGSRPAYMYLFMLLQWLILPVSLLFFSAIPCIDAVTHLMVGKYLGFNVSVKKRA